MKPISQRVFLITGLLAACLSFNVWAGGKDKDDKKDHDKHNRGIPNQVDALAQQVADLQATVADQAIQIADLIALVNSLNTGVDLGPLTARVDALEGNEAIQDGRLDSLETAVDDLATEVAGLGSGGGVDLGPLTSRVTTLEGQMTGVNTLLSGFSGDGTNLTINSNVLFTGNDFQVSSDTINMLALSDMSLFSDFNLSLGAAQDLSTFSFGNTSLYSDQSLDIEATNAINVKSFVLDLGYPFSVVTIKGAPYVP